MGLQAGVDVERRRRERPQRRRDRRAERHVEVAPAEDLHLDLVAGHLGMLQVGGVGDALAVLVDEDRINDRI